MHRVMLRLLYPKRMSVKCVGEQALTPIATLNGPKMPVRFTAASATKPEAIVAIPIPHVDIRNVSASECDGYPRLWCSVTIHDSNAVARRVAPAP